MTKTKTPPWEKKPIKGKRKKTKLTAAAKASAKAAALKAGRQYPNLIDNMRATKRK